jgi:hypothetical protein
MYVPRVWVRRKRVIDTEEGKRALMAWGFGENEAQAGSEAERRLERQGQWLRDEVPEGGEEDDYDYGSRPLREEILQVLGPDAILTRNRQGVVVLNAAKMLFLDARSAGEQRARVARAVPRPERGARRIRQRHAGATARAPARVTPPTTFRVYRRRRACARSPSIVSSIRPARRPRR